MHSIRFSFAMLSRLNVSAGTALVAIGLFLSVQPCNADDNLAALVASNDNNDVDDIDDDDGDDSSRRRKGKVRTTANGRLLPAGDTSRSIALIAAGGIDNPEIAETEAVVVHGFDVNPVEYPALPEVEGTRINSGKKTSFVKPDEFPTVANNNYREVVATTAGIIVSEEPSSPIVNFGYRGFDSQRSEFTQVLKDGISIKNEQFGFPETHYAPILDSVERIEFIRGGAALQFGPQPGGAINFVTKMPRRDAPFHFVTKNAYGSDELFTNYTAVDGTIGKFGYYAYYDHRQREGFRRNGDYDLNAGSVKLVYDLTDDSRIILIGDIYYEEHGEPGGLRRKGDPAGDPPSPVFYEDNRNASTRLFDRFRLQRDFGVLEYQKVFSEHTEMEIKAFGGYLSRWSKRQRGGDLGSLPVGGAASTNSIQDREVWSEGLDARLRHDYQFMGDTSTFAGGVYFYHALQTRTDQRGTTPDAESGNLRNLNDGETWNGSIFAENRFHFGRLSITPGMRIEFIGQSLDEIVNVTRPVTSQSDFTVVPLFGFGASYILIEGAPASTPAPPVAGAKEIDSKNMAASAIGPAGPPRLEVYGNFSRGYRPRTYGELVPTSATGIVNEDLEEGHSLEGELGLRGKPLPYLKFDLSGFYTTFSDQISELTFVLPGPITVTQTQNVGDARYFGFEASAELDILALINGGVESPYGQLNLFGNITWLDAEFTSGPAHGKIPVYAPDCLVKTGAIYRWKNIVKLAMIGTIIDDHFADANNSFQRFIPAYNVWDLTAEMNFWNGRLGVFAGINNLFDEDFWAEVRDEGIVPAYRRNYYGGVTIRF